MKAKKVTSKDEDLFFHCPDSPTKRHQFYPCNGYYACAHCPAERRPLTLPSFRLHGEVDETPDSSGD